MDIIFGYSRLGKSLCDYLLSMGKKDIIFCDSSNKKIGEEYRNIPVVTVANAIQTGRGGAFFVASLFHHDSMKKQLLDEGVEEGRICKIPEELIYQERSRLIEDKKQQKSLQFEVDIAMHCNLKCKSCHHFSPLAVPEVTDLGIFESDMIRMGELFQNYCDRIYLLGGEPLLNENIAAYLQVARVPFPKTKIELITNGLWLDKMEDNFWDALKENEIQVSVTKYPIAADYQKMKALCEEKSVLFEFFGSEADDKHMSYYPLDCNGGQAANENFYVCNMANKCITLKAGKLYPCVVPPNIYHFNEYFGENLVVDERDGINIYQAKDKDQILEFLAKPIPFCRYCRVHERTYDNEWEFSQSRKEEWT